MANGSNGGTGSYSGGASGGGSINIFYKNEYTNTGNYEVNGGTTTSGKRGGNGGTGSISIGSIEAGTYQDDIGTLKLKENTQELLKLENESVIGNNGNKMENKLEYNLEIEEKLANGRRGILILYALPDTVALGLKEAEAYAIIWDSFQKIQQCAPTAMVYYGQETGLKNEQKYDELGVLLPIHQFKNHMLHHLECIDGIVLSCRENMFKNSSGTIPESFIS